MLAASNAAATIVGAPPFVSYPYSIAIRHCPALSGITFDRYHSYLPIFVFYEGLLVIPCLIFIRLGAYPYPPPAREPAYAELAET